jgi:hypothetical protein
MCHLVGDYFLQSDWMAMHKGKKTLNCLVHVLLYTSCFLFLTLSWKALLFIGVSHFILDRFPIIIKRMIWIKNHLPTSFYPPFEFCDSTGYFDDSPYNTLTLKPGELSKYVSETYGKPRHFHITIMLYIITDNTLHLACNLFALTVLASS